MKVVLDPKAVDFISKKGKSEVQVFVKGCSS